MLLLLLAISARDAWSQTKSPPRASAGATAPEPPAEPVSANKAPDAARSNAPDTDWQRTVPLTAFGTKKLPFGANSISEGDAAPALESAPRPSAPRPTTSTTESALTPEAFGEPRSERMSITLGDKLVALIVPSVPIVVDPNVPSAADAEDALLDVVAVGDARGLRCTGIVIAADAVLTARHCLPATRVYYGSAVNAALVVTEVVASTTPGGDADVALVWTAAAATVPARDWHDAADGQPSLVGEISGFGATDALARRGAGEKRRAVVPLVGWGCDLSRSRTTGCRPDLELVVLAPGGVDTCDGDSGGPIFERVGGELRLLGITSRPLASARKRCGDGGIYTRIDKIADWLRAALKRGSGLKEKKSHAR